MVEELMQAIGTYGFPIVMCLVLFWYIVKQNESHKVEIQQMTDALNNNTIALIELRDKIGDDNKNVSNKP
jgi:preprotein translocase subunit YajC